MPANPWEEFARYSREMLEQQTAAAQTWLQGQKGFGGTMGGSVAGLDPAGNAQAMADLWKSWMGLAGTVSQAIPGLSGALPSGQVAGETLGKLLDPTSLLLSGGSQVGETIQRLAEGPRFADMGATERRMARLTRLWLMMQTATRSYEAVVAEAWAKATQTFLVRMDELQRSGKSPEKANDALRIWIDIANDHLMETHRSERFLKAQSELLRTGMDFLLAEREVVEAFVEPAGLPTRSEIDDVHRTVHDLKQRVRQLERQARNQEPRRAAPPAEAAAEPAASEPSGSAETSAPAAEPPARSSAKPPARSAAKPAAQAAAKPAAKPERARRGATSRPRSARKASPRKKETGA